VAKRELTDEERRWVLRMQRCMRDMPSTLWLFSNGSMTILHTNEAGVVAMTDESVDQDYIVAHCEGYSEGGDW